MCEIVRRALFGVIPCKYHTAQAAHVSRTAEFRSSGSCNNSSTSQPTTTTVTVLMATVQALTLTLLVLLLHTTTASDSQTATISYHAHYPVASERPNTCEVAFRSEPRNVTYKPGQYIPFIGTSISRDSQLLVMRLLYSLDYPVKHFMVVVPRRALQGSHAMAYELKHLMQYGSNIIIIACEHPPSVTEGWNAVFHTLPDEPWGIYNARDTAWEPGSLAKAAEQFWPLATAGKVDVGLVGYSNLEPWPAEMAKFNVFMLTRSLVQRFGYFDESIYPAYCEDDDFVYRLKLLQPPGVMQQLKDVYVIHGARSDKQYHSGIFLSSEEGKTEEHSHSSMAMRKGAANCNYFLRKWGCRSELAKQWVRSLHNTCKYKTPFGKDVPLWFWRTSKKERELDKEVELRVLDKGARREVWDIKADRKIFDVPEHYGTWGGYYEPSGMCRLTGELGRISPASPNPANNSSPAPNCL